MNIKNKLYLIKLLLVFGSVIFASQNNFSFENINGNEKIYFNHSPFFHNEIDGYTRLVNLGDGHTAEVGLPELPLFNTFYQLDPNKLYDISFEVINSYTIENIDVLPHQGMKKWKVEQLSFINEEVYNDFVPYPKNNLIISDRAQGRGIEYIALQIIPYKYYPKYKKLEIYSDVQINIVEVGSRDNFTLKQPKRSRIFDNLYNEFIINFDSSYHTSDYQASSILYIMGGDWSENSYVQDLINWRHKQGYIVHAVRTDEIGAGNGNENTIRNYIKNAYEQWNDAPEIVGLIGDTDVIDCFYQQWGTGGGWNNYNGSTDSDYGLLDDNVNDLIPEVLVGRISAQGTSTMENVINKTIQYEKALYVDDEWFMRAALVGDPSQSGNSTIFTSQNIDNIMTNHGMTGVESYYLENGISNWLVNQFNEGISYYNYRGIYGDDGTDFSQLSNQINNGLNTPFVTVMTCGTGDFDEGNSQSEEFVKYGSLNNPKGAVAAIGLATVGTHTAYNNILDMGIYHGIFSNKVWYAGAAELSGDLAMISTYPSNPGNATEAFTGWSNLIGDPALHLWSGVPKNFAVDYLDVLPLGTNNIDIVVYDEEGNTVEGARVTLLMGNDDIFVSDYTDQSGEVNLQWDYIGEGIIDITVINRNYRPYESTIEISSESNFSVGIVPQNINVQSGKETDINVRLKNYGNLPSQNISIEISSLSEFISINSNEAFIENINPSEEILFSFPIYTQGVAFYGDDLRLKLHLVDDYGYSLVNIVPIDILGSKIHVLDRNIEDSFNGVANLKIELQNLGNKNAEYFSIELIPDLQNYEVRSDGFYEIYNFGEYESILIEDFLVSFNDDIIPGSIIPIEFLLSSEDGYERILTSNITFGQRRESDPIGPDNHGYYIYDSGDIEYDLAPEYDWIEIAAPDNSNKLNIVDYGNGEFPGSYTYGSEVVDLPFTFTFYGIDYNQIVVNANGWISFGDFKMYSFRNYSIPGAGGPSPMVAAFWDDLKTGDGGYIHYVAQNDKVIIQWENLRTYDNNGAYRETFQIILYNKEFFPDTDTGDSEIKIQYKDFNNTSDGYYPNGDTPTHGCYSTIGIENHLGNTGIEYTFNNIYSPGASRLEDGSAIFITTRTNSSSSMGDINLDGNIDILDLVSLANAILSDVYILSGDLNQDGTLDILDIVSLVNYILES